MDDTDAGPQWLPGKTFAYDDVAVDPDKMLDFEVRYEPLRYMCRFTPLPGADVLHVSLNSVLQRERQQKAPVLLRWRWGRPMAGHVLAVFDPSLHLHPTMRISCFMGTWAEDATLGLIRIATKVAHSLGVPPSRVIYWGASAAGFGAAMAAIRTGSGSAVAVNPLLDMDRFQSSDVAKPVLDVFGVTSFDQVKRDYPHRISTSYALQQAWQSGHKPRIVLVQNRLDAAFYRSQFLPFCRRWGVPDSAALNQTASIMSILFEDAAGHGAENAEALQKIMRHGVPYLLAGRPA